MLKTPFPVDESVSGVGALAGAWLGSEGEGVGVLRACRELWSPFQAEDELVVALLGDPDCTAKDMLWGLRGFQTRRVEVEWAVTKRALSPG